MKINKQHDENKVKIVQFRWAGKWGPFRIKSDCEECELTISMIKDMINKEFKGKQVTYEIKPWLDNWIYCIARKTWHPPIIMVNGKKFYQFSKKDPLFDREKLKQLVLSKL